MSSNFPTGPGPDTFLKRRSKTATAIKRCEGRDRMGGATAAAPPPPASSSSASVSAARQTRRLRDVGSLGLAAAVWQVLILFPRVFPSSGYLYRRRSKIACHRDQKKVTLEILREIDRHRGVLMGTVHERVVYRHWMRCARLRRAVRRAAPLRRPFNSIRLSGGHRHRRIAVVAFLQCAPSNMALLVAASRWLSQPRRISLPVLQHPAAARMTPSRSCRLPVLGLGVGRVGYAARFADVDVAKASAIMSRI